MSSANTSQSSVSDFIRDINNDFNEAYATDPANAVAATITKYRGHEMLKQKDVITAVAEQLDEASRERKRHSDEAIKHQLNAEACKKDIVKSEGKIRALEGEIATLEAERLAQLADIEELLRQQKAVQP